MKLYHALLLSLLGHGVLLLPSAGQPLPEVTVAPMQVSLAAGEAQAESRHVSSDTDSILDDESRSAGSHNMAQTVVSEPGGKADDNRNPARKGVQDVVRRASEKTSALQPIRFASNRLSRQQAQTRVVSRLHHELRNYFVYPMLARRNGWEGKVVLALDIYVDGRIYNVQLKSGSGHHILDRSALNAVSRIHTLPNVPEWHGSSPLNVALPVIYRLQG